MSVTNANTLPEFIAPIIENLALEYGFTDFVYHTSDGLSNGNEFSSLVTRIVIDGVKNDEYARLNLICKYPPADKDRHSAIMEGFEREVRAYSEILPEYENFQLAKGLTRNGDDGWWSIPKCYYTMYDEPNDKCVIILEDLCERNFQMAIKRIPSTYPQTKHILQELGKFHAVSFAMKLQKPELYAEYRELRDVNIKTMRTDMMTEMMEDNFENAKKSLTLPDDYEALLKFMDFHKNLWTIMPECVAPEIAEPYSILVHSDCWINNVMFSADSVCMFDWQFISYGSPALDLMMYLLCSADSAILENHFDELIDVYYTEFTNLMGILGENGRLVFPRHELLNQLKLFGRHGLGMALFAIPVLTNDIPGLHYLVKNYGFDGGINDEFRSRMSGAIKIACKFGIL